MTCRVAETGICYFLFERSSRSTFNNYLYKFFVEFVYPACFTVSNKIITGCAAQYPLQHKKKAAIHLTDTRQYPQLFLFVDYECIFLSDFALLKSVVRALRKDRLTTAHFVARVRFVKTERFHSHWHWGLRPRRARQISLS